MPVPYPVIIDVMHVVIAQSCFEIETLAPNYTIVDIVHTMRPGNPMGEYHDNTDTYAVPSFYEVENHS